MHNRSQSIIPDKEINVEEGERMLSAVMGSLLLYRAFKKGGIIKALTGGYLLFRGATGYCPAYEALEDKGVVIKSRNINIKTSVTVKKPRHEVYDFWRKLENLPLFMKHIKSVEMQAEKVTEWKARIPGGLGSISWKTEIVEDQPNERIGWSSLPGSTIENAGNIHFRDAGKFGTEVHAVISYHAPAGKAGETLARLFTPAFEAVVREDIKNFKRYLESGEIPTIEGQPSGRN